jgi:hypothetical protein
VTEIVLIVVGQIELDADRTSMLDGKHDGDRAG